MQNSCLLDHAGLTRHAGERRDCLSAVSKIHYKIGYGLILNLYKHLRASSVPMQADSDEFGSFCVQLGSDTPITSGNDACSGGRPLLVEALVKVRV